MLAHTNLNTLQFNVFTHTLFNHSGILLKDLVAVDSQSKDYSDSSLGVVNINKYRLLWTLLSAMKQAQLTTPKTPPDVEHMRILRVSWVLLTPLIGALLGISL